MCTSCFFFDSFSSVYLFCHILFYFILFSIILWMPICFLTRDRKGINSVGEKMEGISEVGEGETVIKMYCMNNI